MVESVFTYNPGQNCRDNSCVSPSPITILIFHGLQNQDPFIDRWHVSTLSGGKGGAQKRQRKKNKRCSYNDGSVIVSSQAPNGCNSPIGPCGQKIKKRHMVKMFVDLIVLLAASRR